MFAHRTVIALTIALLAATVGARATEHYEFEHTTQACANAIGEAYVGLESQDGILRFTGTVVCDGASSVEIWQLRLRPLVPAGARWQGGTASCINCGSAPVVASGTAVAANGLYEVEMFFNAAGNGKPYPSLIREARFLAFEESAVQPVRYCWSHPSSRDPRVAKTTLPSGPCV